jgi:phenylacetate-coenzyme A ligase PaaK-like adenylate-forming protein
MIETAVAQLRFAASVLLGRPFALWSLDWLLEGVRDSRREFGAVGAEAAELIAGPALDEETRREVQLRRFRDQAVRAARETDYYRPLFARLGLDPARLSHDDVAAIPVTPKDALRDEPDRFVRRGSRPAFRTTTTGTTGRPTSVCFSEHEIRVTAALSAINLLMQGHVTDEDIVQISTSSRATLGNHCFARACERIGALWYQAGLVEPALALALLAEQHQVPGKKPRTSFLSVYPSVLGELVEYGLAAGYRPADFGLERIAAGGEIVTAGLKDRARRLFGPVEFIEGYAMTETWPLAGTRCAEGHLHFEVSQGLVEVLDPETGAPAGPGRPGTIVATPFAPYRDASVVLRYDTQDVVRTLDGPPGCSLRHLPATSNLLGKLRLSVRHADGWTFPRDVLEALEALDDVPLPARCGMWAVRGGAGVEVVVRDRSAAARGAIAAQLEAHGVPLEELRLVDDPAALRFPLPLRCDLREASFRPPPAGVAGGPHRSASAFTALQASAQC